MRSPFRLCKIGVLAFLLASASTLFAGTVRVNIIDDTFDTLRLSIGVESPVLIIKDVGAYFNLDLFGNLEVDVLPFLTAELKALVRCASVGTAESSTATFFTSLGLYPAVQLVVWHRDKTQPHRVVLSRTRVGGGYNYDIWNETYINMDLKTRTSLGLYARSAITMTPSFGPVFTSLSATVFGICYESRADARVLIDGKARTLHQGMETRLYFQRTSESVPFPDSMRVGLRLDSYGGTTAYSLWGSLLPFARPITAYTLGVGLGFSLDTKTKGMDSKK